ncbi:interleukin-18 receptor 1 isoform X1 [Labrus bergylta]|uniref:interleukin-18 receptor 1 isoform X1 n=1 Tax=Labrus bergylta TaxID=56723 RepID=UPI0033132EA8
MMAVKILFLLSILLTGVFSLRRTEVHIKAGEMVALWCPHQKGSYGAKLIWSSHTAHELDLSSNMSADELSRMGVLVYGRNLVILSASVNHQGNYSCSQGNASSQFMLTVYTGQSGEDEDWNTYSATCFTQESCTLHCPDVNIPDVNTPNMTSNDIIWHKRGESLPQDSYFSSVTENDHGVYTCTRSYLYHQLIYNITFKVMLVIRPNIISGQSVLLSPHMDDVFHVALDSTVVIECTAVIYSDFDEVFWLSGSSFLERDNNLPVFYNYTRESNAEGMKMTASLVFKKVTKEDLRKSYTCKLDADDQPSSFVRITLAQKASPLSVPLALGTTGIVMMIIFVTAVVYVKFKMNIALFLRDTLSCTSSSSDGKSHDAFLMYYKSNTGLNNTERETLESVLEESFGYNLCTHDRNVSPGKAVAETVLYCIEQSQSVVLVPTSSDPGLEAGLLKDTSASLVERQNHLVFIKFKSNQVSRSGSVPEALRILSKAGHRVTWKRKRSMTPSSLFWKQLRYHLPAPQAARKIRLSPQPTNPEDIC